MTLPTNTNTPAHESLMPQLFDLVKAVTSVLTSEEGALPCGDGGGGGGGGGGCRARGLKRLSLCWPCIKLLALHRTIL